MARVRLVNQLLAALKPGKVARGAGWRKNGRKKEKKREKGTNLVRRKGDEGKKGWQ